MAPPIVDPIDSTVFVNSPIAAANLFSAFDADDLIEFYTFSDFRSSPNTGYFSLDGVAFPNGSTFTIPASDLSGLRYIGGSQISYEGFKVVARDQAGNFSSANVRGQINSVRSNTTQPHVSAPKFSVLADEYINGSDFIFGYDPDGYPLTHFRISEANKVLSMEAKNGFVTVTSYEHRFQTSDYVTITGADQSVFNVTAPVNVLSPHVFRFKATGTPDGVATGTIGAFSPDKGYFQLDGNVMPQGQPFTITADEVDRLRYYSSGKSDEENIYLQGFDGVDWSYDKKGLAATRINANRPVVQFGNVSTPADAMMPLKDSFQVTDADGNTMKSFWFYNTSPHPQNGDLIFKGAIWPRNTWFKVEADEMDQLFFKTSRVGFEQQIRVVANDGKHSSAPGTLLINSTEPIVRPELEINQDVFILNQLETVLVSPLVRKVDPGTVHTRFQVYEPTTDPRSGTLVNGPTPIAGGVIHEFDRERFHSSIGFKTGDFYVRNIDTFYVRSTNDTSDDWGKWTKVDFRTEPEFDNALNSNTTWEGLLPRNSAGKLEVTFSFMQQFPDYNTGEAIDGDPAELEHFEIFNNAQRENARLAFRHIEEFANVQMIEVADTSTNVFGGTGGIIRMGEYGQPNPPSTAAAFAFFPGFGDPNGDMWFNRLNFLGGPFGSDLDFTPGSWGYKVFLHEFGHAMGLKHPHDGTPRLPPTTDVNDFSVMSYVQANNGEPTTFQLYDINELQDLYGANMETRTGNDTYSIAKFWGGRQAFVETIWDAAGNDTLSAMMSPVNSVVDLREGQQSSIGFFPENVTIAIGAKIENGIGSANDDELYGNALNNTLLGREGDDYLYGNAGNDFLTGAEGDDIFEWGVGDGNDVINEQGLGGRDTIRITEFPTADKLEEDFKFRLNEQGSLMIDLHLDGGAFDNSIEVVNQGFGGYRIESLELGGVKIDLANLTSQLAPGVDTFRVTASSTPFGQLVVPV